MYTTFEQLHFEEGTEKITFCDANAANITAFFSDLDGSLRPAKFATHNFKYGTLVSNVPQMMHFVYQWKCTEISESCYSYCKNTCFRGIRFDVNPAGTKDYHLQVCAIDNDDKCTEFPGYLRGRDPTSSSRTRKFNAYLPKGKYTAKFIDHQGRVVWPSFVEEFYQKDNLCPNSLNEGDVKLIVPAVNPEEECIQLVKNSNMDLSDTDVSPWLHRFGGIELGQNKGIGGSNALTSLKPSKTNTIIQYLDMRCIKSMVGHTYEMKVWVKLENLQSGEVYHCDPNEMKCPEAGIVDSWGRSTIAGISLYDDHSIEDQKKRTEGFQLLRGEFQITEQGLASQTSVGIFIRSNIQNGLSWFIDSVSVKLVEVFGGKEEETLQQPTHQPTLQPTTHQPTLQPTHQPTLQPTHQPTLQPTHQPTLQPSLVPTQEPTSNPTQQKPTTHDFSNKPPSPEPTGMGKLMS